MEDRLLKTCGRKVDFNVDRALQSPSNITAFGNGGLVSRVEGRWAAVPLTDAKKRLDKR